MPITFPAARALGLVLLFSCPLATAQSIRGDGHLLDRPDGARVAPLKDGLTVRVEKRQGLWVQVKAGSKAGWVRLNQLRFGGASGMVALDTGRATADNIVSTSVARGLSAKDVLNGRPDAAAVARLDTWIPEAAAIERFMAEAGVRPVTTGVTLSAAPTSSGTSRQEAADEP